jgi:ATP-dependent Clp protease protease subunit
MARIKKEDLERFHEIGVYLPKRTLFIGSEQYDGDGNESGVDGMLAQRVIKNLLALDTEPHDPITIIMNNAGGSFYDGLAIYDAIKSCKSKVTIIVYGQAFSMASIILQAADERIMAPNAVQMMHYGSTVIEGDAKNAQKQAREDARLNKWTEHLYLDRMRQKDPDFKLTKLKQLLTNDTYLTADESIEMGLADKILGD